MSRSKSTWKWNKPPGKNEGLRENHKEFLKNSRIILRLQLRFKSEKYNVYTTEINKITLSANDDKKIQLLDSIETYAYGTNKNILLKNEKIKHNSIIKNTKIA